MCQSGSQLDREDSRRDFDTVLLEIQQVDLTVERKKVPTVIFFDNGSTTSLVTHSWAKRVGLKGVSVTYYLRVVGEEYTKKETNLYTFAIVDM